jgi:hypothetical protein
MEDKTEGSEGAQSVIGCKLNRFIYHHAPPCMVVFYINKNIPNLNKEIYDI